MAKPKTPKYTTVRVPYDTYVAVKRESERRGCFVARVLADAVNQYFLRQAEVSLTPKSPEVQAGA